MKKFHALLVALIIYASSSAQFVAKMEVKEPIPGVCNNSEVYVIFPSFSGQTEAEWPMSKKEIIKKLNEVAFLKDSASYNDKGMVNIIINCKGEAVQVYMDNKTRNKQLDDQIVAVLNSLGAWKAAKINKRKVDSSNLWSFEIKDGKFVNEK
jgi:DNA-binding protein YbaB